MSRIRAAKNNNMAITLGLFAFRFCHSNYFYPREIMYSADQTAEEYPVMEKSKIER
ncbi:hypothetical protein GCM10008018_53130 [Paenibacillus marchantiophytorum]|uniref:Cyclic lactone autoinducer peptide n=1 Tax=Paenibacillus marchantiophytorum TaxID=1619310 RepID=A0ABQ1F5M5_9BACL|nr:hypothetical protein GCM10008018_53130 [Paenibacillus marchantiophytorum]